MNLVADAIKDIIDGYRGAGGLKYVVIAGGDEVIPFFRYPDTSGSARRTSSPRRCATTPRRAPASTQHQVLSQDAYGAARR